jgi:hypothetical protein
MSSAQIKRSHSSDSPRDSGKLLGMYRSCTLQAGLLGISRVKRCRMNRVGTEEAVTHKDAISRRPLTVDMDHTNLAL